MAFSAISVIIISTYASGEHKKRKGKGKEKEKKENKSSIIIKEEQ
jgi:hypothetical protein